MDYDYDNREKTVSKNKASHFNTALRPIKVQLFYSTQLRVYYDAMKNILTKCHPINSIRRGSFKNIKNHISMRR